MGKVLVTVALDTKTHLELANRLNPVLVRHIAVTFGAIESSSRMHLMVEEYEIGKIIYPHPTDRFPFAVKAFHPDHLRIINCDFFMTEHAGLQGRNLG
jgi:hypothetical protein